LTVSPHKPVARSSFSVLPAARPCRGFVASVPCASSAPSPSLVFPRSQRWSALGPDGIESWEATVPRMIQLQPLLATQTSRAMLLMRRIWRSSMMLRAHENVSGRMRTALPRSQGSLVTWGISTMIH
jgi:hypothetical protein